MRKKKKFRRRRVAFRDALAFWNHPAESADGDSKPERKSPPARHDTGEQHRKTGKRKSGVGIPLQRKSGGGGGEGGGGGARTGRFGYGDIAKLAVTGLCAVLSLLVAFDGWRNADDVYGGVSVGGVGVGGESREEAEQVLVSNTASLPEEVTFEAGEKSVTLSRDQLGIEVDAAQSVDRAFSVGRDGGFTRRLGERIESSVGMSEVRPEISYEEAAIRKAFEVEATEAAYQPTDGPDTLVSITPSEDGVRISDEFWENLDSRIMQGDERIEVPLQTVEPELTTAEAEELQPTEALSSFSTNYLTYDDDPGRVTNLQISSEAINGTFLAPGEVFSFNELAEPLDYEASKVIVRGKVDTADGGGLCQVSSTLYVAANLAGLEIVERSPHMAELPYIQPGLDATVWFGALDMKFKNTSPGYLYLQQWVDTTTGDVSAVIYGIPSGVEGTMDSERIARYKDADKNIVTEWVTYRTITKNGEVVESGPVHTDTYTSLEPEAPVQ